VDYCVSYCNKGVGTSVCMCYVVHLLEIRYADCSNMHGMSNVKFAVSLLHLLIGIAEGLRIIQHIQLSVCH
jgi:hypothetical protein